MSENILMNVDSAFTRVTLGEPIDPFSWAWMKELREHHKSRKIYDIDPFVEVYQFRDNFYGIFQESTGRGGDVWMYLIVGPEKALLMDTGFGIGDLEGLCNEISGGKPLIVANTHPDGDHASGNFQFDTVHIHESAVPTLQKNMSDPPRSRYPDPSVLTKTFDLSAAIPSSKYNAVGVKDGHIFELGDGYNVELIFLGGHSVGQSLFLDKQNRIAIVGDDILTMRVSLGPVYPDLNGDPNRIGSNVQTFAENLRKLSDRLDEFDHVFSGHFAGDLESRVVNNMLEACEAILEHPDKPDYVQEGRFGLQYFKFVKEMGVIAYTYSGK